MDRLRISLTIGILILNSSFNVLGMFEAILIKFDTMVPNNKYVDLNLKVIRFNRTTFVLNGSIEIYLDTIDDVDVSCLLYRKGGNEYKLTPYKIGPGNFCEMLLQEKFFYPYFLTFTENFPPVDSCDFKPGIYIIRNFIPDLSQVPPVFQSGDYMTECKLYKNEEFFQGYEFYGQLFNIASAKNIG